MSLHIIFTGDDFAEVFNQPRLNHFVVEMDAVGQLKQRIEADFSVTAVQHICDKGRNKLALMKSDGVSAGAGVIDNLDFFMMRSAPVAVLLFLLQK